VPDTTPLAELTDEALLEASIDGNRRAFTALVERYRTELLHFLIRFLGSRTAADDVFQEAFLQVHLSARSFDVSRRFKPWLFTIAANKARDHFRRNHRQPPLSLSAAIDRGGDRGGESDRFVDLLSADQSGPESPIGDAERSQLVRVIVDQMPPHHREILLLSYFQRLSYNQIADALSIPLGTVKSRLHAAVANFAGAWRASRGANAEADAGLDSGELF
jgi:RNA polymerase sigma-70 factor (ECF subfamily)